MHRSVMMLLPAAAMTILPPSQAGAAGTIASCFHSWTDHGSVRMSDTPPELRPLDAILLATASLLGDDLGRIVTYDERWWRISPGTSHLRGH